MFHADSISNHAFYGNTRGGHFALVFGEWIWHNNLLSMNFKLLYNIITFFRKNQQGATLSAPNGKKYLLVREVPKDNGVKRTEEQNSHG